MPRSAVAIFRNIILAPCIIFLLNSNASPQDLETSNGLEAAYKEALDKYHNEDFEGSLELTRKIRRDFPAEPVGAFGMLATYQTIMRNYRVRTYESKFDSLVSLSLELSKKAVKKDKKNGRNYFYLGVAHGLRSTYYANRNKWMSAFRDGSQVLKNFNKAIAYSPQFYDSYYGIGLYKYWLGAKSKWLRALPFAKKKRREGIEKVKIAMEKGEYLNTDAMYGLTSIYYNEKLFEPALEIVNKLTELYPRNPTACYRRGRILQALERWQEALESFASLHGLLRATAYESISYQVEVLFQMAKCCFELDRRYEAARHCREAIALESRCDFSKEMDGPLESFAVIKEQLHELNDQVKDLVLVQETVAK